MTKKVVFCLEVLPEPVVGDTTFSNTTLGAYLGAVLRNESNLPCQAHEAQYYPLVSYGLGPQFPSPWVGIFEDQSEKWTQKVTESLHAMPSDCVFYGILLHYSTTPGVYIISLMLFDYLLKLVLFHILFLHHTQ